MCPLFGEALKHIYIYIWPNPETPLQKRAFKIIGTPRVYRSKKAQHNQYLGGVTEQLVIHSTLYTDPGRRLFRDFPIQIYRWIDTTLTFRHNV